MSKAPWPDRLNRITRSSFASRAAIASSIAPRIACADSGAGTMPSVLRELDRRLEHLVLRVRARPPCARACTSSDSDGASPWYRRPPACTGAGTNVCPSVYIGTSGVMPAVSPKS